MCNVALKTRSNKLQFGMVVAGSVVAVVVIGQVEARAFGFAKRER